MFFGSGAKVSHAVYVVDFSGSMSQGNRIGMLKKELDNSLSQLPAGVNYNIIYYSHRPWMGGENVGITVSSADQAERLFNSAKAGNSPLSIIGSRMSHVTPSKPTSRTRSSVSCRSSGVTTGVSGPVGTDAVTRALAPARPKTNPAAVATRRAWIASRKNRTAANNNAPIAMSVKKAATGLIKNGVVTEGLLNTVEMAFRNYDPCMSCATHSLPGQMPLEVTIRDTDGKVVDVLSQYVD